MSKEKILELYLLLKQYDLLEEFINYLQNKKDTIN